MARSSQDAAAALEIVRHSPTVEVIRRLRIPEGLTDDQRAEFQRLINEMPAEWFTPGNTAMLTQYCRHVVTARRIAELIEAAISNGEVDELDKLVRAQVSESRIIHLLMTALRLTPQAVAPSTVSQRRLQQIESPWSGFGKKRE